MNRFISGKYIKHAAGTDYEYRSFSPSRINRPYEWGDSSIDPLLEQAAGSLKSLNTYANQVPDVDFFIKMHVAKEATTSSRIEGTRTEIGEVFLEEEEIIPERRDDWKEVQNYIKAMNWSVGKLGKLPLSMRLLRGAHGALLSGVRGKKKRPGRIRDSQNWIGGRNIESATFVPPDPEELPELLSDLEKFWHNQDLNLPHLVRAGMSHYQFETIHPFLDGNRRIGRLLITLYLISVGVLDRPVLYLSDFFSKNRQRYFRSLEKVREEGDLDQWLSFFLEGVIEVSKDGIKTLREVVDLKKGLEEKIDEEVSARRKGLAREALHFLFSDPLVSINELADRLDVVFPTASALLEELEKAGLVGEITGKKRNRRFELMGYIDIFRK